MASFNWPSTASGGGIATYPNFAAFPATAADGTLAEALDTNIIYAFNAMSMTWVKVAGPGNVLGIGTIDSTSPSADGAKIVADNLIMQSASDTVPGLMNLVAQNIAGNKTFTGIIRAANLTGTNTGDVTLGTANGLSFAPASQVLSLQAASTTLTGALTSTDWNTFNSKQASGSYITALTGDGAASGPGSAALTLATVNANVGPFGSSTSIPTLTLNAKGLVTAASGNVVIAPAGTLTGTTLNSTVVTSSLTSLGTQSAALNMGSHLVNAVTDPVSAQDAATKNYVDMVASSLNPLQAVYAASVATIAGTYANGAAGIGATFTTTSTSTFTLDGATPPLTSRVLIKNQSSGFQNGIYTFTTAPVGGVSGAILTRSLDFNSPSNINAGDLIPVVNGTVNALTSWLQTATVTTVGTDPLVFVEWTANPANYLLKANNLSDVASKPTSFNNISPMTTAGDIIYENASPVSARLPIGSNGNVLTVVSGLPAWAPSSGGSVQSQITVTSGNGDGSTNTVIRRYSVTAISIGTDIVYADSATDGASFTIATSGTYSITRFDSNSGPANMGLSVNATSFLTTGITLLTWAQGFRGFVNTTTASVPAIVSISLYLTAGDVVRPHDGGALDGTTEQDSSFTITRVN